MLTMSWTCWQDVVTGSLLDAQDRAQWLLERKRYQEALHIADSDSGVPAAMRQQACLALSSQLGCNACPHCSCRQAAMVVQRLQSV